MLCLEGAQAGLSWYTVLKKREHYRIVFDNFDASKIAGYGEDKRQELLSDPGIIRNKLKVNAFIVNAQAYLKIKEEYPSFDHYIWQFTDHNVIDNKLINMSEYQATSPESDAMSKDLKKRGFKFVGSTICYAFMQACGMVNDHLLDCWVRADYAK
jgi:DNA-3-methyladenine glycosylase I